MKAATVAPAVSHTRSRIVSSFPWLRFSAGAVAIVLLLFPRLATVLAGKR